MENVNKEKKESMPNVDISKEKPAIEFNKLLLESELLRQQVMANNLDLWSAKFNKLADLIGKIDEENKDTKTTIEAEMARLLNNIISLKV